MNNADEIREQIQAAKDQIISAVSCTTDYQMLVDTRMLERLVNDLTNLERQLIEAERVILKPFPNYDSLAYGQKYFVSCCKGGEREIVAGIMTRKAIVVDNATQIFIPIGEPNE